MNGGQATYGGEPTYMVACPGCPALVGTFWNSARSTSEPLSTFSEVGHGKLNNNLIISINGFGRHKRIGSIFSIDHNRVNTTSILHTGVGSRKYM